ncbi:MAG: serine/threonine-protein kinase, partial [Acidobacteriota bacterium]
MSDPERWRRVESLLDRALDRPAAGREDWVRSACPGDRELAEEVLELLAAAQAAGPLDRPFSELAASAAAEGGEPAEGRRVGSWRLLEPLASGGMGRVFIARRDGGDFQQRAAVKLLRWEVATPHLEERFRTERQILAGLEHPGIARLIDGGVTADGVPYLAMELVEGQPIHDYCRQRKVSLKGRLRLFLEVCEAVRAAHARLVIHRDLKPSNILVTDQGTPRLLDFGVGKFLRPEGSRPATLTLDQMAPATPAYAAPEQLEGEAMTVATDVYGLGAVLFELLTGRRAFDGDSESPALRIRQVLETEASPPSRIAAAAGELPFAAPALRGDLDNIVLKALRKEPRRRYASVEALAADVRRYLDGQPVAASPATAAYRLGKFLRRHRVATSMGLALVAGALVAGLLIVR